MNEKGFTLIEMLLVACLLAAMAGLGMPLFRNAFHHVALASAADGVRDAFAFARDRAIRDQRAVRVAWAPDGKSFGLSTEVSPALFEPMQERGGHRCSFPAGVLLRSEVDGVTFFPDGTATPADVELMDGTGNISGIRVEPVLGRAIVHDARG